MINRAQSKSFLPLPESKRYPRIFRLKTASLVVLILIIIIGIIDLFFLIYMRTNPEPSANTSFINDVAIKSNTLKTGDELNLMLANLLTAYPRLYYQYAHKLAEGTGTQLTAVAMRNQIFSKSSTNLLFLLHLRAEGASETQSIAIFSSSYFQVPQNDYNSSLDYYTLGSASEGQAVALSLTTSDYLVMNGTSKAEDILKCKTYILSQKSHYFSFLSSLVKELTSDTLSLASQPPYQCFHGVNSQTELVQKLKALTGMDGQVSQVKIEKYEVYQLQNQN